MHKDIFKPTIGLKMKTSKPKLKTRHLWPLGFVLLSAFGEPSYAGEMGSLGQNELTSPWEVQFGNRYWYSSGRYQEDLYGWFIPRLASRLTFSDIIGQSAEGFWQLNHSNGLFIKGYIGGGAIIGGHLNDEDFPPFTSYSNTFHPQKNGNINYFNVDIGYQWGSDSNFQVGSFIGYHHWVERLNSFGYYQLVKPSNSNLQMPTSINILNLANNIDSLRIGVNNTVRLLNILSVSSELAYVHSYLSLQDFHNLRTNLHSVPAEGQGNGLQLEAALNWHPTQALSIGVGGRLWAIKTKGYTRFEQASEYPNPGPQASEVKLHRYGLFLNAKYRFIDTAPSQAAQAQGVEPGFDWRGFYGGANVGYGANQRIIYVHRLNSFNQILPRNMNVQDIGFLGGGQLGYNHQLAQTIVGVEADLDYASLGGAKGVLTAIPSDDDADVFYTSVKKNVGMLSTVRARIGQLISNDMLIYLTGGPALGKVRLDFDQRKMVDPGIFEGGVQTIGAHIQNKLGWTIGTGTEYAVSEAISLKAEYLYTALGKVNFNTTGNAPYYVSNKITSRFNHHVVRLGINFKF